MKKIYNNKPSKKIEIVFGYIIFFIFIIYYIMSISTVDLYNTKYTMEILEKNINQLDKKVLLYNQKLTAEFCIKYIFDMDIESGSEDSYLYDKFHILKKQTHITEKEFDDAYDKYYK